MGPKFVTTPLSYVVHFSNSSGTKLQCSAKGRPMPVSSICCNNSSGINGCLIKVFALTYKFSTWTFFSLKIVEWKRIDGKDQNSGEISVTEVPGILSLTPDNRTLTFNPFSPSSSSYVPSIHASTYKCVAKNKAGIISTPPVDLEAGM